MFCTWVVCRKRYGGIPREVEDLYGAGAVFISSFYLPVSYEMKERGIIRNTGTDGNCSLGNLIIYEIMHSFRYSRHLLFFTAPNTLNRSIRPLPENALLSVRSTRLALFLECQCLPYFSNGRSLSPSGRKAVPNGKPLTSPVSRPLTGP